MTALYGHRATGRRYLGSEERMLTPLKFMPEAVLKRAKRLQYRTCIRRYMRAIKRAGRYCFNCGADANLKLYFKSTVLFDPLEGDFRRNRHNVKRFLCTVCDRNAEWV